MLLEGKTAVISGAASPRGIGFATARLFAKHGAKIAILDLNEQGAKDAAAELGPDHVGIGCDVANLASCKQAAEAAIAALGQVDILLNNAAAPGQDLWVWEQTLENFNATIAIDLTAAMLCTREVLNRSMLERKTGAIINFSSTAAWPGSIGCGLGDGVGGAIATPRVGSVAPETPGPTTSPPALPRTATKARMTRPGTTRERATRCRREFEDEGTTSMRGSAYGSRVLAPRPVSPQR